MFISLYSGKYQNCAIFVHHKLEGTTARQHLCNAFSLQLAIPDTMMSEIAPRQVTFPVEIQCEKSSFGSVFSKSNNWPRRTTSLVDCKVLHQSPRPFVFSAPIVSLPTRSISSSTNCQVTVSTLPYRIFVHPSTLLRTRYIFQVLTDRHYHLLQWRDRNLLDLLLFCILRMPNSAWS
jgi:hypothetical protein